MHSVPGPHEEDLSISLIGEGCPLDLSERSKKAEKPSK